MKRVVAVFLAMCLSFPLSGCDRPVPSASRPQAEEQVVLNILWAPENNWSGFDEFLALYEERTGNKIEIQYFPAVEYDTIMRIKMSSGEGPDIFRTDAIDIAENIWPDEWFYDLSEQPWISRLTEQGKQALTWINGKLTQAPLTTLDARGMLYNRDVLRACGVTDLPKTWDEFISVCERVKKAGYIPVNVQAASDYEFGTVQFFVHAWQAMYLIYGEEEAVALMGRIARNELGFSDIPEYQQGIEQLLELQRRDLINNDYLAVTMETTANRIVGGKCAFTAGGEWALISATEPLSRDTIGVMPLPLGNEQGVMVLTPGIGIAANANSKNLEAALEFIDLWCSKEWQEKNLVFNPGISFFSDVKSTQSPLSNDIEYWMARGRCLPTLELYARVFPELDSRLLVRPLLSGELASDAYLRELDGLAASIGKDMQLPGW